MEDKGDVRFRYKPVRCTLLKKQVWAIMTQQSDGQWRVVNCLDKERECFSLECAFTTDHGEWPYTVSATGQAATR